jgi:hypothetical protein
VELRHKGEKMVTLRMIKREFLHVLPVFIFFLFFFTLINWTETYLFENTGIKGFSFSEVALAAALIAKIVLVLDHWRWINRYKKYPLAVAILWKTFLYWIILFVVRLAIKFIPSVWLNDGRFETDIQQFFVSVNWNIFFSVQMYYLMLLFIYVTFVELVNKIGRKKVIELFFG